MIHLLTALHARAFGCDQGFIDLLHTALDRHIISRDTGPTVLFDGKLIVLYNIVIIIYSNYVL